MPPETVRTLLDEGRRRLRENGIDTPALDARLLLQKASALAHEEIVAAPQAIVDAGSAAIYRALVARRAAGQPVSRLLGEREFHGRVFAVTPDVLDPRADTETLIAAALARPFRHFIDLGTGSGAIAVTLACEMPQARGVATDISPAALAVARANAERHNVADRLDFARADWFDELSGQFDLIVSNPPYIVGEEIAALAPEVRDHDPSLALDGGPDGLAAYRWIAAGADAHLLPSGLVVVEIGAGQEEDVSAIFVAAGFRREAMRRDLAGRPRCLTFSIGN